MDVDELTVMQAPDGRLYQVPPDQVETVARDQGWSVAPDAAVHQRVAEREQYSKYGSTGQQTLGLAETAMRNATLGAVPGVGDEEDIRGRANVVAEESPVLNAAAGAVPAIAATVALPELALPAAVAAQGAVGGLAGVGAAADEAFRHDKELSAEAAFGSFGAGFLLGGAAEGGARAIGSALGGVRNRFVEAAGRSTRKAEAEALEAAGIVKPVDGLSEAIKDPVKAAELRKAGKEAAPRAQKVLETELGALDEAEAAAHAMGSELPEATGDAAAQRGAARKLIEGARKDLEPIADEATRGVVARSMENLDRATTGSEIYQVARQTRAALEDALDASADPAVAKVLQRHVEAARAMEADKQLFGPPAEHAGLSADQQTAIGEARQALTEALDGGSFMAKLGTKEGAAVQEKLDAYLERLSPLLEASDAPAAQRGLEAIAKLREMSDKEFRSVAGANQAALMSKGVKAPSDAFRDLAGEAVESAAESAFPPFGMAKKLYKHREAIGGFLGKVFGKEAKAEGSEAFESAAAKIRGRQGQEGYAVLGKRSQLPQDAAEREMSVEAMRGRIGKLPKREIESLGDLDEGAYPIAKLKQKKVLLSKEELRSVGDYISDAYRDIRATLRGDAAAGEEHEGAKFIESALQKLSIDEPTSLGPLYRGLGLDDDALNEALLKGEFNTSSITSASYSPHEALNFAKANAKEAETPNAVLVRFDHVASGAPVNVYEKEVLLPRGGHFVVTSRETLGDGVLLLNVKQAGLATEDQMRELGALGAADISTSPGGLTAGDILTSPMAVGAVVGAAGLGGAALIGKARQAFKYKAHVNQLANDAKRDAGAAADRLVGTSMTAVGRGSRAAVRSAVPLGARQAYFKSLGEDSEASYARVKNAVTMLSEQPERLARSLALQMGDIPDEAPELLEAVAAKAQLAVQFLKEKLPPAFEFSMLYPDGPPPSRTDLLQLSLYWNGCTNAEEVLKAIGDGSAMPEEVEAFRAVNQSWFAELQDATATRIQDANRKGQAVSGWKIAQLESLLDLPGGLDPTFGPSVAIAAHNAEDARIQGQEAPSYVPPPKAGQRTQPASLDRINST